MIRDEYKQQLKETRAGWEGWGSSAARNCDGLIRYIEKHKAINTVLDFGCGTGTLRKHVEPRLSRTVEWTEYDPSVEGKDTIPEGTFDLLITTDVMEHVEPESLGETLHWMREHSLRQWHHIDCNETKDRLPDGRDVHLIVRQPSWWKAQFVLPGWTLMEYHEHHRRKRGRYPRTSTTIVVERG